MLIRMMTFNGGELHEGIGLEHMAKVMRDMAKDNPKATVDDLNQTMVVVWPASIGTGCTIIEHPGRPAEVIQVKPARTKPTLLQLPTGVVVRLVPDSPHHSGARFISSPNAEVFKQLPAGAGPAPTLNDPTQKKALPLEQAYTRWLSTGDVGSSSKVLSRAICYELQPSPLWEAEDDSFNHPGDWSDFGRCVKMLDAIPQLRDNLQVMRWMSPAWALIGASFSRLEALYRSNAPDLPGFSEAVVQGLAPSEERIASIGRTAIDLDVASGGMPNTNFGPEEAKAIKADLQTQIALHRGALCFEPHPSFTKKKAAP